MTTEQANNISIKQYLFTLNVFPVKEKKHYGMYRSPFRPDTEPSFKVDYRQNLWYDYGVGEGGTMIDLAMKINQCTFTEAMQKLENQRFTNSFFFHGKGLSAKSEIRKTKVMPLVNSALLGYLAERKINIDTARRHCSEVHYNVNGKEYFAIGFANNAGGYELRNKYFKGCVSPKDITTISNGKESCLVFEGFWDFLSYLTIKNIEKTNHDVAVLNSTANVQKAMNFLKSHPEIYTYLDNDEGGRRATELIKSSCLSVINRSERYARFKDLNDFLSNKPIPKPEVKKKNRGIRR